MGGCAGEVKIEYTATSQTKERSQSSSQQTECKSESWDRAHPTWRRPEHKRGLARVRWTRRTSRLRGLFTKPRGRGRRGSKGRRTVARGHARRDGLVAGQLSEWRDEPWLGQSKARAERKLKKRCSRTLSDEGGDARKERGQGLGCGYFRWGQPQKQKMGCPTKLIWPHPAQRREAPLVVVFVSSQPANHPSWSVTAPLPAPILPTAGPTDPAEKNSP